MKIEDYWEDKTEFEISFVTEDNRTINKKIALEPGTTRLQAKKVVKSSFSRVKEVIYVEEVNDLLSYKKNISMV